MPIRLAPTGLADGLATLAATAAQTADLPQLLGAPRPPAPERRRLGVSELLNLATSPQSAVKDPLSRRDQGDITARNPSFDIA
jgi:hypothetical protein